MFELAQQAGRIFGPGIGPHHGFGWLGPLFSLLLVALLVAGAVVVVRMLASRPQAPGPREPLRILEERFARGEIDDEEFRTRRDALRG